MDKSKISAIIQLLSREDREMLRYSHNYYRAAYVRLSNNRFIGVHCAGIKQLNITDTYNDWYIGTVQYDGNGKPHTA